MSAKRKAVGLACPLLICTSAVAADGGWSLGLSVGTLGAGPELAYRFNEYLGVRASATGLLSYDLEEDTDDVEYDGDLDLKSAGLLLDWHPFGGGFRVSLGARYNDNQVDVVGTAIRNVTLGGVELAPEELGTLTGTLQGNDFAPMITIGYGRTLGQRFTVGFELGVMYQGSPTIDDLRPTGLIATLPALAPDIQEEEERLEREVEDYDYWPVAQLQFLYRF